MSGISLSLRLLFGNVLRRTRRKHLASLDRAVRGQPPLNDNIAAGREHIGLGLTARDHAKRGRLRRGDGFDRRPVGIGRRDHRKAESQRRRIPANGAAFTRPATRSIWPLSWDWRAPTSLTVR